jgi:hypothetical protein
MILNNMPPHREIAHNFGSVDPVGHVVLAFRGLVCGVGEWNIWFQLSCQVGLDPKASTSMAPRAS